MSSNSNDPVNKKKTGKRRRRRPAPRNKDQRYPTPSGDRNNATPSPERGDQYDRTLRRDASFDPLHAKENDVNWYNRYPELLEAAARIATPYRAGSIIETGKTMGDIPGVMKISWIPNFGVSDSSRSPINQVARELYARVRAKYSADLDAEGADFVCYIGALDGIFTYIAWLKRVYRFTRMWTPENYAYPMQLIAGSGLTEQTFNALRMHRVELYGGINELIYRVHTFICPAVFDMLNRHVWMTDNIFLDSEKLYGQTYMFNPTAVFKFEELPVIGGAAGDLASGLTMQKLPSGTKTLTELLQFGDDLITALANWSEAKTINGYFLRVFENEPIFRMPNLAEDEVQLPVYSEEVLSQIENTFSASIANPQTDAVSFAKCQVAQDTDFRLITQSTVTVSGSPNASAELLTIAQHYMNFHHGLDAVPDVIVASRMHGHFTLEQSTGAYNIVCQGATEIALDIVLCGYSPSTGIVSLAHLPQLRRTSNQEVGSLFDTMSFDWHPFMYAYSADASPATVYFGGDCDLFTVLPVSQLLEMHKVALFSELNAFSLS